MRSTTLFLAVLSLGLASLASADWRDHKDLPDWARRGYVQWGHGANIDGRIKWMPGGFAIDVPNCKMIISCGRNIQQTVTYTDKEAEQIAKEGGLRRQPYICSQTVWWKSEEAKTPELKDAVRKGLDGRPIIIYNNPERHCGCYSAPFWLEYTKRRIDDTRKTGLGRVDSIFFDNPYPYDCYCSFCREAFKRFSRETFGTELDLTKAGKDPTVTFARNLFQCESTVHFFEQVRAYIRSLGLTLPISPNLGVESAGPAYITLRGGTDMVFCEEGFSLPPFQSTVLGYKIGLAASHGLAVGQLLGLPEELRRARALKLDPGNEAGILESFMYPEEHKLSFAEAAACDGTYIESFALREQKISVDDSPDHVAVRQALQQYATFEKAQRGLYDLAQPGARVAVLYSIWTDLADRSRPALNETCTALGQAGIPYEIIIEEDLKPKLLAAYRLLIMPGVRSLSAEDAQAIMQYLREGGAVVISGAPVTRDRLCHPYSADNMPMLGKLPVGEPRSLGTGRFWRISGSLAAFKSSDLPAALERVGGRLPCLVKTASPRVFANLLRSRDGNTLSVHLVNSDFSYDESPSADIRDDHGTPMARTFFAALNTRARKVLNVPDLAAAKGYALRFFGNACWAATDNFSLVVSLNGKDIATLKGSALLESKWYELPIPEGLLQSRNEVTFRAIGSPSGHPDWFALRIDTGVPPQRSWWSEDGGKTWSQDDLSPDTGVQKGEYMVRLGPPTDPAAVAKPEDFLGKLHVRPARDIDVVLRTTGPAPVGKLVSPDGPEREIVPRVEGDFATYRVPEMFIYSVLVLSGLA